MKAVDILRQLPSLLRYADVQKFTGNANVFLMRARASNYVERVARGVYLNRLRDATPGIEEVACYLRTPSYISCEWALNRHGLLLQAPTVCTALTLGTAVGKSRNLAFKGVIIEFSHISPRLFTGFEQQEGYNLALPEKALLDVIYLRKSIPFRDELELEDIDEMTLQNLAEHYPPTTRKRLEELMRHRKA